MKTLRIYNYEILNFDTEPLIFSTNGFTQITNPKIVRALQRIEETHSKYIKHHDLEKILRDEDLHPNRAIDFLKSLLIIGEPTEPPHFQNIIIYHDLEISGELKNHLEKILHGRLQIKKISLCEPSHTNSPTLFVFICAKIRPDSLRATYTQILDLNPDCGASIGFISGNYFHLTEAHIPSIGNPCAFCTLDRIAHYETLRTSQHHWSKIWTFCRDNSIDLPKVSIDELQKSLIFGTTLSFTSKLAQPPKSKTTQDQVLLSRTINLETGKTSEDASIHWPLCQCLGPK